MDATRQEKLKRFSNDRLMNEAVHFLLLQSFLKPRKGADVHELAASRIAIDMLQDAWKDLERYKQDDEAKPDRAPNPGV